MSDLFSDAARQRLPEIARTVARAINQFRNATADLRKKVEREVDVRELRDAVDGVRAAARLPQDFLARTLSDPDPAPALPPQPPPSGEPAASAEVPGSAREVIGRGPRVTPWGCAGGSAKR